MADKIRFPDEEKEIKILDELVDYIVADKIPEKTPNDIYHYTSTVGLKGIIENNSLWFTHFEYLNDKSERYYAYNLFNTCLGEEKSTLKESFYNALINIICIDGNFSIDKFKRASLDYRVYYVCSFSLNNNSLSLWNYYTKTTNKTGYSIKLNSKNLVESLSNKSFYKYKVNYDVEAQKNIYKSYISSFNKAWDNSMSQCFKDSLLGILLDLIDLESLVFKHPAFINEEEFRIVFSINRKNSAKIEHEKIIRFRESNGIIIPYLHISFDKRSINEVIISPTQQDSRAKGSLLMLLHNCGYTHIKEEQITISDIPIRE